MAAYRPKIRETIVACLPPISWENDIKAFIKYFFECNGAWHKLFLKHQLQIQIQIQIQVQVQIQKPEQGSATKHRRFFLNFLRTADSEQESAALIGRRFLLRICGQNLESAAQILRAAGI